MRRETALDRFKTLLDELGVPWEEGEQGFAYINRGGFKWWVGNAMPQNDPTLTRLVVGCCYPTQDEALGLMGIGEEECEIKAVSNFPTSSMTASWGCLCTACGAFHELTRGDGWRYCPSCGKKVKKEGQG